nr:hypothetical protein BaRGS_030994 [Batillaria attramentaria]
MLIPYYVGRVLDGLVIQHSMDAFHTAIICLSGVTILLIVSTWLRMHLFVMYTSRLTARIRRTFFASVMRKDIAFFDTVETVGVLCFMLQTSWRLTVLAVMCIPAFLIVSYIYGIVMKNLGTSSQSIMATMGEMAEENFSNIRTVRSFAMEEDEVERFAQKVTRLFANGRRESFIHSTFDSLTLTVFQYLDCQPRSPGSMSKDAFQGEIEFRDVTFAYASRPEQTVLNMALVGQEPVLFSRSIRENITYGLHACADADVISASVRANAHEFIVATPAGYETCAGEKGLQLSGGQKQRVAIARALVRDPAVLILDEATSALDSQSEAKVQEALSNSRQGRTVLVIAHRLSTVEAADRVLVVDKGRVVEDGPPSYLLRLGGLYSALVRKQLIATGSQAVVPRYALPVTASAAEEGEDSDDDERRSREESHDSGVGPVSYQEFSFEGKNLKKALLESTHGAEAVSAPLSVGETFF